MSFTCLNSLQRWTGLRNAEEFNSFARCSLSTATTPTLHTNNPSIHPIDVSPDLDLRVISNMTEDRPKRSPDPHDIHEVFVSGQSSVGSVEIASIPSITIESDAVESDSKLDSTQLAMATRNPDNPHEN